MAQFKKSHIQKVVGFGSGALGDGAVVLAANPGRSITIKSMIAGNLSQNEDHFVQISVQKRGQSVPVTMIGNMKVPAQEGVEVLVAGDGEIYLEGGDSLRAVADAADTVSIMISYVLEA